MLLGVCGTNGQQTLLSRLDLIIRIIVIFVDVITLIVTGDLAVDKWAEDLLAPPGGCPAGHTPFLH